MSPRPVAPDLQAVEVAALADELGVIGQRLAAHDLCENRAHRRVLELADDQAERTIAAALVEADKPEAALIARDIRRATEIAAAARSLAGRVSQ